jgi:hypothetical protein
MFEDPLSELMMWMMHCFGEQISIGHLLNQTTMNQKVMVMNPNQLLQFLQNELTEEVHLL